MLECFSRSTRFNLLALLRAVSKDHELPPPSLLNNRQVGWIIEAGLGPFFWDHASQREFHRQRTLSTAALEAHAGSGPSS